MIELLKYWYELYRAYKRGDKRIAPRNVRGRVYEKRGQPKEDNSKIKSRPEGHLSINVIRKDGE